jgi:hypothetical protein
MKLLVIEKWLKVLKNKTIQVEENTVEGLIANSVDATIITEET